MSDQDIVIGVRGDVSGGVTIKRSLDDIARSGKAAQGATDALERQMSSLRSTADLLKRALIGIAGAMGVTQVARLADQYQTLNARLKEATRLTGDYSKVQRSIIDLSLRTGSTLEANITLFQRLANSRNDLGATNEQMVRLVDTVNKLGTIGGASVEGMKNGTIQLSQALSGGVVRAEEFNSVVENINPVAQAVAREMGISFGELRKRIVEGTVSSKEFFNAIIRASSEADESFVRMPMNLARAFQNLKTATQVYVGDIDSSIKATSRLADVISLLANNIDILGKAISFLAVAYISRFLSSILSVVTANVSLQIKSAETAASLSAQALAFDKLTASMTINNRMSAAVAAQQAAAAGSTAAETIIVSRAGEAAVLTAGKVGILGTSLKALKAIGSSLFALMGGWVGIIIGLSIAIYSFRDEIMKTLDKVSVFGVRIGDVIRDIDTGSKIIISSLGDLIDPIIKFGDTAYVVFGRIAETIDDIVTGMALIGVYMSRVLPGDQMSTFKEIQKDVASQRQSRWDPFSGISAEVTNNQIIRQASGSGEADRIQQQALMNQAIYGGKLEQHIKGVAAKTQSAREEYGKLLDQLKKPVSGSNNGMPPAIDSTKKAADALREVVQETRTDQERLFARIAEMESLKPFAKTAEQADAIDRAIKAANDDLEALRVKAETDGPVGKAFASLAGEIDDGFKDAFKSAFTETDGGFKKLIEGWKNTFKSFLAEMAYQALARPIVLSVVGSIGGSMGLSSSAVASILGTGVSGSSSGSSGSSMSIASSLGSLINGGLYSSTLGKVGYSIGNLFSSSTAMGPSTAGYIGSQALGNLGYGVIGGGIASLLGLGNKNPIISGIAGTLGSIGGSAVGASMGTVLGMAGGPVGAVVGSFLGTALSGLFGGKKPSDMSQSGTLDFATLSTTKYGQTGKKYSAQNASFRDSVLSEASNLVTLLKSVGGTVSGGIGITIGNRDGLRINGGRNYGTNSTAFISAVMQKVVDSTTGLSETFQRILDKVGVSDTQKLSDAFTFGQSYDALLNPVNSTEALSKAIAALDTNMQSLIDTATSLGLPTEEYTKALEKQKDASVAALKAQAAGFQDLETMTQTFKAFLDGQALGSGSSLSPTGKLELAQSNFGDLLAKAQGGDLSVTQQLLSAANDLLTVGRGVYASTVSFAGLETFVRSSVKEIAHAAGVPGYASGADSASSGMAFTGEQGRELVSLRGGEKIYSAGETAGIMAMSGNVATDVVRTNAQVVAINGQLLDEIRMLRSEALKQRKAVENMSNRIKANGGTA